MMNPPNPGETVRYECIEAAGLTVKPLDCSVARLRLTTPSNLQITDPCD